MTRRFPQAIVGLALVLGWWLGMPQSGWAESEAFTRGQDSESEFQQLPDEPEPPPVPSSPQAESAPGQEPKTAPSTPSSPTDPAQTPLPASDPTMVEPTDQVQTDQAQANPDFPPEEALPPEPAAPEPEVIVEMDEPAKDETTPELSEVTVTGERPLSASSDQTVRNKDFMNYPRRTASDLLRFVPGLHITQHTGGAKAHQIFLRGFDAEHGQDVAAFLDGIPLNESSHVHGAGYLDLHFLLPESVAKIWVVNGPYDPRYGNYSTAGVINFLPYKSKPKTYNLTVGGGSDLYAEGLAEYSRSYEVGDTYLAAEFDRTDGYTDPGYAHYGRGFAHQRFHLGSLGELRLLYAGYGARSEAADILPKVWIDEKKVSRFDSLDDSNRVDVDRHLAGLTLDMESSDLQGRVQAYYNYKATRIFSNYSFYYFHPEQGDQLEQRDKRHYAGLNTYLRHLAKTETMDFSTEAGFTLRNDWISQTQASAENRERFNVINHYEFTETALGLYLDERMQLAPWVRLILGMRYDLHLYEGDGIQDRLGEFDIYTNSTPLYDNDPATLSTYAQAFSPKATAVFCPLKNWNIFLNFGRGFVSQYARQLAWKAEHSIPAVMAAELGSRLKLWQKRISLAASGWWAEKESELIFDSEFGNSLPRGKSRRFGADLEFRISPIEWLYLGTDVFYVHARFVENNQPVPNMAEWLMTNFVGLRHPKGFNGSLRGRFLGPRKHDMGYESDAYYLVDLQLGYDIDPVEICLMVENLFNIEWYDSVYAYPSRPVRNGEVLEGLHVTPGTPTTARLRITTRF